MSDSPTQLLEAMCTLVFRFQLQRIFLRYMSRLEPCLDAIVAKVTTRARWESNGLQSC